jgi:hypothetical protein
MSSPEVELQELMNRFGAGIELVFEGAAEECPICRHDLSQLALIMAESGFGSTACEHCGTVLAA